MIHRDIKPGNLFLCDTRAGQGHRLRHRQGGERHDAQRGRAASSARSPTCRPSSGAARPRPSATTSGRPAACSTGSSPAWLPRVFPDAAGYAAAALRGDPVPGLREVSGAPAWLADAVMAMLDPDPARRPAAADCVRLLSGSRARRRRRRGRRAGLPRGDPGQPGSASGRARQPASADDAACRRADGGLLAAAPGARGGSASLSRAGAGAAGRGSLVALRAPRLRAAVPGAAPRAARPPRR